MNRNWHVPQRAEVIPPRSAYVETLVLSLGLAALIVGFRIMRIFGIGRGM